MRAVPCLTSRTQAVGILLTVTGLLTFLLVPHRELLERLSAMNTLSPRPGTFVPTNVLSPRQGGITARQGGGSVSVPQNNSPTTSSTPTPTSTTPQQQPSSSTTRSSVTQQSSATTVPPTTEQSSSPTPTSTQSTDTPTTTSTTPHSSVPPQTSAILTTNQGGQTITSIVVISDPASSSSTPTQSSGPASPPSSSSGVSSSTIIGLSVAGGVAVLCIVGFFVWKFTRKHRNEFNDSEEIKWPELNAHDASVPLPTHRTGGAGIDTADVRRNSVGYAASTAANSTAELYPDPYAVPPLPHLDPNQAYHDDPSGRYYDPYHGPVPQTFEGIPGESIPMTQLAGRRSPGPGAVFGGDLGGGRASPAPQGPYDFGGRASPAPQQGAYGMGMAGRASPGPGAIFAAGGRASPAPAPQAGYGNYGPR